MEMGKADNNNNNNTIKPYTPHDKPLPEKKQGRAQIG